MGHEGVMVFAEQIDGKVHPISFELLGKGREIADKLRVDLSSVLLGYEVRDQAMELVHYGADTVFLYDHSSLKDFDVLRYKQNVVNLVREEQPEILLVGATHLGRSLGPRIAAALETGLTADCIDLSIDEDGGLIQIRPAFTGNILAYIKTWTKPQMATIRYRVMERKDRDISRSGEIIEKDVQVMNDSGVRIIGERGSRQASISDADVIVSAGRGLKKPEDFELIRRLADALGGVVGASRPLVEEGWIGKEHQVGFSGNTVKAKLYVACGISGSPQHLAGMRYSDTIVAINTDGSAPIFEVSDYAIEGDLYEVIPELINEIEKIRGRK
jgi:electron transfer flavoprotein alpha subunit